MNIYPVRHGETDWNRCGRVQGRADMPLNALGLEPGDGAGISPGKPSPLSP